MTPPVSAVLPLEEHRTPVHILQRERTIGALLIDAGKLDAAGAERVLRLQQEQGLPFGEAAIRLRLVTAADIREALSLQFDYPYLLRGQSRVSQEVVAAYQPFSRQVEALRALRSQLLLRWIGVEPERRTIVIASPARREGRSYLAANLAVVFSQLGARTLLIDADMRNPRQHLLFGLENRSGLSTGLAGRDRVNGFVPIPDFESLSVLPAGPVPPNPQELLSRPAFSGLLEGFCRDFDVVLIDSPAAESGADTQTLAVRASAALVVTRKNHTSLAATQALVDSLQQASAKVVGAVLNRF